MKFKRLFMQRFMSVGDEPVEIIFPDGGGITQVQGINKDVISIGGTDGKVRSNASGKSTLIEGILFGLTGKILRGLKLEDCLHDLCDKNGIVEFEFDNIKIVRKIKPNNVQVFVDGEEKTHKGSKVKTKKNIEEDYVGVNFETMANILVFGQHNLVSFLGAEEKAKREIVENLMNLKEYNLYEEKAKERLKTEKARLAGVTEKHNFKYSHLDSQKALLQEQLDHLAKYRTFTEEKITAIKQKVNALPLVETIREAWKAYEDSIVERQKMESHTISLKEKRNHLSEELNGVLHRFRGEQNGKHPLVEKLHSIKEKYLKLEAMKRDAVVQLDNIKDEMIRNERELDRIEREKDDGLRLIKPLEDWDTLLRNMTQMCAEAVKQRENVVNKELTDKDTCPTCYGVIDIENAKGVVKKWDNEIESQTERIEDIRQRSQLDEKRMSAERAAVHVLYTTAKEACLTRKTELQTQWQAKTKQIDAEYDKAVERLNTMKVAAEQSIKDFDEALQNKFGGDIASLEQARKDVTAQIDESSRQLLLRKEIQKPQVSLEETGKIDAQRSAYEKEIVEKEALLGSNPYADIIKNLQDGIDGLSTEVTNAHVEIKEIEGIIPYYDFWADAMGKEGLKSFIIDQIVPSLNQQIDYWMQSLYQGAISLTFDKYLNVHMVNKASGNEMVFGQGSGSEQKRVDLSIMLAFREIMKMSTGTDPSIIFFDEVADSLDDDGIYHVYKTIEELAKTCHVFVITHHPTFKQLLENSNKIVFVKEKGATKLVA